jgi:hypothetical protein
LICQLITEQQLASAPNLRTVVPDEPQINHRVNRIRRLFEWSVARELIPVEAFQSLKTVEGLTIGHTEAQEGRKVTAVSDTRSTP